MLQTTWERAEPHEDAFVAWLCYDTTLPVFETRRKSRTAEKVTDKMMFEIGEIEAGDDVIETEKRVPYRMRLPYTAPMLTRRAERGADVPVWWKQVDTFTLEAA